MAVDYTTARLIKDLKRRGSIPTAQELFEDEDFCDFMTDCQKMRILPQILKTREEHFVHSVDIPMVEDQDRYDLPTRAIGQRIRNIYILRNGDDEDTVELPRIEPEDENYRYRIGYFFEGSKIVLTGRDTRPQDFIRIKYHRRPSRLVPVSQAMQITDISPTTNMVTVNQIPEGFVPGEYDITQAKSPFDAMDSITVTAIDQNSMLLVLSPSVISQISIGDWITEEECTVIPQIPVDLHEILLQYALVKALEALGDRNGVELSANYLAELEESLYTLLEHRDQGHSRKVRVRNTLWHSGYDGEY